MSVAPVQQKDAKPNGTPPSPPAPLPQEREEMISKHIDELVGLLMASYANVDATRAGSEADHASRGRHMMAQMRRAKEFLGKVYDGMKGKK